MAKQKPGDPYVPGDTSGVTKEPDGGGGTGETQVMRSYRESDTTHVIITNPETAVDDLAYLAKKLGLDINQLRQERLDKGRQEKVKQAHDRQERQKRARELQEAALVKKFLERQNKTIFVSIDGKPIQIKEFENVKCPSCSYQIGMAIRGRVLDVLETHPYIVLSPLSSMHGIVACADKIYCTAPTEDKRHTHTLRIQQIDFSCEP